MAALNRFGWALVFFVPSGIWLAILCWRSKLVKKRTRVGKKDRLVPIRGRRILALAIILSVYAAPVFFMAKKLVEPKPWCYAFLYYSMGPDGSLVGGKEVLALTESVKGTPAHNVTVTIFDDSAHSPDVDPSKFMNALIPVVYPYYVGPQTPCRFTPTRISYEPAQLGDEYWVWIQVENGEDVVESIKMLNKGQFQCIRVKRLRDGVILVNNYESPFDHFGGCMMSQLDMSKEPASGAEWITRCHDK